MTTKPPRIGLAVLGAGMASAPHFASLADLADRVEVRWLVGQHPQRIEAAAARFPGARTTTDLDAMLADPQVRAVLVLTPPATHRALVERIVATGRHVLLEKPLEVTPAAACALVAAADAADVRLAVMLQHRLRAPAVALAALVHEGGLGQVTGACVEVPWWRPQSYYDEPGRGTLARDGGGVLLTQAIHQLDLFVHVVGLPVLVTAFAATSATHRMECEDIVAGALRWRDGAVGTLLATTAAFPGHAERIVVTGTAGTATLAGGQLQVAFLDGRSQTVGEPQVLGGGADPMAFHHGPHREVIADFLDAIAAGRAPRIDGHGVLRAHRLIEALLASSREGRAVAP